MLARSLFCFFAMSLATCCLAPAQVNAPKIQSNAYKIDLIEINDKYVVVHFEMAANKRYTVQASPVMPAAASNWVNVLTLPVYPFDLHYAYADTFTNKARYYRLRVQ
jgi:hypothetical protein